MMKPFEKIDLFHQDHQAKFVQLPKGKLPISYAQEEQNHLSNQCGLLDCKAFELVRLWGKDVRHFLNGMVTNHVLTLQNGESQQSLICQHRGKILTRIDILQRTEEDLILLTEPNHASFVIDHLQKFHIQEDVEILLEEQFVYCQLIGQNAEVIASQFCQTFHQCFWWSLPFGNTSACCLLIPYQDYFEVFQNLSCQENVCLIGFQVLENKRIDELIPRYGVDYENCLPEEASLTSHMSYRKGCYLGQETHARMKHLGHPNKKLMGLKVPCSVQLQAQDSLFENGKFENEKKVATVTSVSKLQHQDTYHAIAMVNYKSIAGQTTLTTSDGQHEIKILPVATDQSS